jgi:hypothetical protein
MTVMMMVIIIMIIIMQCVSLVADLNAAAVTFVHILSNYSSTSLPIFRRYVV